MARDLADILGSGEEEAPSPASTIRSASPKKNGTNQRAGASKHYHAVRLFEDEEERPRSPEKGVVPKQYQHFEFGAGEDVLPEDTAAVAASAAKQKKHASQWDFEDFMTPNKAPPKLRPQDQRTFGWSDDEDEKSPVRRPVVHQPRPDAKAHFEFVDDGTPAAERKVTATKLHNQSLGLYKDHVVGDDDADDATLFKKPLATVTNINNQDRHRDFGSSWEMRDDSPSAKAGAEGSKENHPNNNQKKVLNGLNANWGIYDESPDGPSKENHRAIKSANNGPGGRKRQEERHWGNFAEDYAEEAPARPTSKARPAEKSFWDF